MNDFKNDATRVNTNHKAKDNKSRQRLIFTLAIVLFFTYCIGSISYSIYNKTIQIDDYTSKTIDLTQATDNYNAASGGEDVSNSDAIAEAIGLDKSRVIKDTKVIENLLELSTTWSSGSEYSKARNSIIENYDIPEDSNFLTVIMPQLDTVYDSDGNKTNIIDMKGINMTYKGSDPLVLSMDGTVYYYGTTVEVSVDDSYGGSNDYDLLFTYSVDAKGNLGDIDAQRVFNV